MRGSSLLVPSPLYLFSILPFTLGSADLMRVRMEQATGATGELESANADNMTSTSLRAITRCSVQNALVLQGCEQYFDHSLVG